jgi:acetyl esterase/lipase
MTKKVHLTLLFLFFSVFSISLFAQNTIKIWEGTEKNKKQNRSELSVYIPEKGKNTGISVIICPGGSYRYLGMKKEGYEVAEYLQSQGIAAFVLRYRIGIFGNRHPAMIQDLQRSIQLVKGMCKEMDLDPDKVGVMGFSAGGHLAGIAGTYFDTNFMEPLGIVPEGVSHALFKPAFIAMIYPVISMSNEEITHKRSRRNLLGYSHRKKEMEHYLSLEEHVREDMPPVFLLQCKGDKTVNYRNSECYDKALSEKNVEHKYLFFDEKKQGFKGHAFGIHPNGITDGWHHEFVSWVQSVIR